MDRIRNERIRGTTKVGEISKKVKERRSYRHEGHTDMKNMWGKE